MNSNWLSGIRCPKCGAREPFWIQARVHALVYDAKIATYKDVEWDDDFHIACDICNHMGLVIDFLGEEKRR